MIQKPILFAALTLAAVAGSGSGVSGDLLAPVTRKLEVLEAGLARETDARTRARALLLTGKPDDARAALGAGEDRGKGAGVDPLEVEILFALSDFEAIRSILGDPSPLADPGGAAGSPAEASRRDELIYRWLRTVDDLGSLEARVHARLEGGAATPADHRAHGTLAALTFRYDEATAAYEKALAVSGSAADSALALTGLGDVANRERDFDRSLAYLEAALPLSDPDPDLLVSVSNTLIRLGRTDEAIAASELAVRIAPYHERGHYLLGNGYARKNYTQLFAAFPDAFAAPAEAERLAGADARWAAGSVDEARAAYEELLLARPAADVLTRLGSLDYLEGDFAAARARFARALSVCPEYGRAHNGMAKAVEGQRLAVEVHRRGYEEAFAGAAMPGVPGIETFVTNWKSLSDRHRKRVALSMEPWKRYIPVLVASGSTYYIKPLYERLSETPGQELLRDQRISYDSRLWDDVRGCGGYHTVTGIEDVERTIRNRYNTVLHELTHQVHAVMPADRKRQIQELYRRTKERDEAGEDAFLSRYAGGSVWEYFAEGANALHSPRRDAYDDREIVLERLDAKDEALKGLVRELLHEADVESCYVVGFTNRGDDRLERGRAQEAIAAYRHALIRDPAEETALGSLIFSLEVAGSVAAAREVAERVSAEQPESATLALRAADCRWMSGEGVEAAIARLEAARPRVRGVEQYRIDQELGRLYWVAGRAETSRAAYARVLEYQSDDPQGVWGMASAHALAGEWSEAWARYDEAVRLRTGVVELRADYARDLLRAGERDRARGQIEEGLLLDPDDPNLLAMKAWSLVEDGDLDGAEAAAGPALAASPWCDAARIALAMAKVRRGERALAETVLLPILERMEAGAAPEYVYRSKWGRYDQVRTHPAVERALVAGIREGAR